MCEEDTFQSKNLTILANQYTDVQIQDAYEDIKYHFMDIYNGKEYLKFDLDVLRNVLLSDNLNIESEEIVFETIKKWLEDKQLSPEKHLHILIDVVRLRFLSLEYLWKQVEAYASGNDKCVPMFLQAIKYHLFPDKRAEMESDDIKERKLYRKFLAVGSWSLDTCGIVELYDSSINKWTYLKTLDIQKRDYGAVIINNTLMIMGGYNAKVFNTVEIIDLATGRLTSGPPMIHKRCNVSAMVIGDTDPIVYIVGGVGDGGGLTSSEKWDPVTRQWTLLAPMSFQRDGGGCTHLNGKIYAAGGRNGNVIHNSLEEYNIKSNHWEIKAPMNKPRSYCRIVASKKYVYAMGGYPGEFQLNPYNLVERYDPKANAWINVASVTSSGLGGLYSYGTFGNRILFVGGAGNNKMTEEYDEEKNVWKMLAPLNFGRDGSTVVEIPKKMINCKFNW